MTRSLLTGIVLLGCWACGPAAPVRDEPMTSEAAIQAEAVRSETVSTGEWSIRTFSNTDVSAGFGFDILNRGKVYVHQPTIPAVQGVLGFASEEAAKACAELMLYKIRNGILPPSVTVQELDSLGISR